MSGTAMTTGTLHLVATPIGNLGDMTARAIDTLRSCPVVCCEDTRHSGRLLQHFGISPQRMIVVNEHTEYDAARTIVEVLQSGTDVALVTDAGSPGISDPGEYVVAEAVRAGVRVTAAPGASALVMALTTSGLPTRRFVFEGFLPRSGAQRSQRIDAIRSDRRTTVLYEAPHRLHRTLDDLLAACGAQRRVVVTRELTKLHEEIVRGALGDVTAQLAATEPRGEYVIVIDAAPEPSAATDDDVVLAVRERIAAGASTRDAAAEVAEQLGVSRRRAYELALNDKRV
ncbi:MAG: 16S rRNA (cytidine(1402)-2'-O)-methyltransferase [Ilumatobacteraceae bacterium]|jgi:16S rRNA (cytidine1402-2'-O)-methyltransferase